MFNNDLFTFLKPKNELEHPQGDLTGNYSPEIPETMWVKCPKCKSLILTADLEANHKVCAKCGHHMRLSARERIALLADDKSFEEFDADMTSSNLLSFPDYDLKLKSAQLKSGENESVVTGVCEIGGSKTVLGAMDSGFMMGSMGTVTGEKITRAFEYATENRLPVVMCTVSGGARMQEGILSLMQMAKTSGAVKRHSDAGLLYITVLTDPTTGGVTASFAMEGDIIISEPNALIGFAGPRVIEQTIKQKLPKDFQTAEFVEEKGFIDAVVPRSELKSAISRLLEMHK
ncbi:MULTISPECIES: acetyl-CoA carboxylase, carboxyltransferase subunit beta [unclassified Ruminococcus]|uniref:acetyl-CoA carboxylase, carboxyltransferase subunit beta n=1 Tax=unclassified Ruminococcus TaxID=2608920 RepID=UPI00210A3980|nr:MULTISPECIES: acetyl-CoA carboxylase, carboxyltransferase subunit beta [unclassified Ruminococcus]MCQ4021997.1 acetyl-CoA carboxylase carboxyltransferase subunit beta [Ruminococcus sp. zg-924]MCQ4114533.1 acetyl-CoA carboxylase carboxyltransferase subunit beta [Ruminococcus sp. zg-921]